MGYLQGNKNINKLRTSDHICMLFDNIDCYREIATDFIVEGLLNKERVLCIVSEYSLPMIQQDLKSKDIDMKYFIDKKQLVINNTNNVYNANDSFNPKEAIEYWKKQLEYIENQGVGGFRVVGEVAFDESKTKENFDNLIEHELLFNKEIMSLYGKYKYLCVFNKAKFPPFVLEDMIKKHNILINNKEILNPNPYYMDINDQIKEYNEKIAFRNRFSLDLNTYVNQINIDNSEDNKDIEIMKHILGATGDGIWELDIKSSKIDLSSTFYDIIGVAKENMSNNYKELTKLIHHEDIDEFIESSKKCLNNEIEYFSQEVRIKKNNGEWVWLLIKGAITKRNILNGQALEMVGIFNNITETKRIKRELEEKIYFEKLRTDFFANLSHEFRTPLNVILGSIQLQELYVNNDIKNKNSDKYKRTLRSMKQNCYRLLRLVNNLIDITKIDTGFYNLELENYDIVNLIKNIVFSVEDYVVKQKLSIKFISGIENMIIACDPEKIERVVLNLLSNSIKFTPPGGEIVVNINNENNNIIITVSDTGLGIPKDKIMNIFDRFLQINESLTRNYEGSGIGLSLVKSIIEMHKGEVYVESKLNKGSKFFIKLPIKIIRDSDFKNDIKLTSIANVERMNIEFADIYSRA